MAPEDLHDGHKATLSLAAAYRVHIGRSAPLDREATHGPVVHSGRYRYCPVATRSMARPPVVSFVLGDEGAHVDDPLALLAGDLGPVIRVGWVW